MNTKQFGARVRIARSNKNITINELAAMVGAEPKTIGLIENGYRSVSLSLLIRLCNTLAVSPEFLLGNELIADVSKYGNDELIDFLLLATEKERMLLLEIGKTIVANRSSFEIK